MNINSTELLDLLDRHYGHGRANMPISVTSLATELGISVSKLISVLTELEQRDKIILNLTTYANPETGTLSHEGTI